MDPWDKEYTVKYNFKRLFKKFSYERNEMIVLFLSLFSLLQQVYIIRHY